MNRPFKLAAAAAIVAALAWLAFGFFGIQAAFIDNEVSEANPFAAALAQQPETDPVEALPAAEAQPAAAAPAVAADIQPDIVMADEETADTQPADTEAVPEIVTLASGSLVDHAHSGEGTINVLTDGDQRFLRFEDDFAVDNGPDLNVYLVRGADAEGDPGLFDDDFIDLGDLKGNIGAQNYELDPDVDLSEYDTVVIWCVRFGVAFNAANLN